MRLLRSSSLRSLLRRLDPELAHRVALTSLRLGLAGRARDVDDPILHVKVLGLDFSNPIGLAAGFDKDAVAVAGLVRLGFGFVETGTVTPRPQAGNTRPRIFRLEEDDAVINRLGFNNLGLRAYIGRLSKHSRGVAPIGANVGINKEGADPERDYPDLVAAVSGLVDYVVINVSSPNTSGLRALQASDRLMAILAAVRSKGGPSVPLLVKVAPDLTEDELAAIVNTCIAGAVHGLVVSNTTVARPASLQSVGRNEAGGLSGAPLFARATAVLARAFLFAQGRLALIGVGGVRTGADAFAKIQAGAHLVQIYTAFTYEGPALLPRIKRELAAEVRSGGFSRIEDAVGSDADRLARLAKIG